MRSPWRPVTEQLLAAMVGSAALLVGCSPSPVRGGFDSPNPAAKLYAIERAARERDHAAIPRIIEQLDSEDPAVRFIAIEALHRMTGETYGYDQAAPRHERDAAVRRWVQAYQSSEIGRPPPSANSDVRLRTSEDGAATNG